MSDQATPSISRPFTYGFTHGTVRCNFTLEGGSLDDLKGVADEINGIISKQVARFLVPKLNVGAESMVTTEGETAISEVAKIELLGYRLTFTIDVDLTLKPSYPEEALRALIVQTVSVEVIAYAIAQIAKTAHDVAMRDFVGDDFDAAIERLLGPRQDGPVGFNFGAPVMPGLALPRSGGLQHGRRGQIIIGG